MPFDWYVKDALLAHPPVAVVPSEDRPEGRSTGAQGHPQSQLAGRGVWGGCAPKPYTLPLIEYAVVHPIFNAMLLFWQQPLWKSIFFFKQKKKN